MQVKAAMAGPTQIGDSLCMTLSPHDLPDDAETLKAMILTARAENARLDARNAAREIRQAADPQPPPSREALLREP